MDEKQIKELIGEIKKQREALDALEEKVNKCSILKMYKIREMDYKIKIPCQKCLDYGEVRLFCDKCGGKGIHSKTKKKWAIAQHMEEIEKISHTHSYEAQYWVSYDTYFSSGDGLLFHTKNEALNECSKRNLRQP